MEKSRWVPFIRKPRVKATRSLAMSKRAPRLTPFTLLELVIVIGMLFLVGGMVTLGIRHTPLLVTVGDTMARVKSLFAQAGGQAIAQGKTIVITYNPESLTFSTSGGKGDQKEGRIISYTLPMGTEVEFADYYSDDGNVRFYMFADGSGSGPAMRLDISGHIVVMKLSALSGILKSAYIDE